MPDEQESRPGQKSGETEGAGTEEVATDPAPTATDQTSADKGRDEEPRQRGRIVRPAEALDQLDRQWEDRRPLRQLSLPISSLVLTIPEDPTGFDYFGAMGVDIRDVADACLAWLDAQLTADALELGQLVRPKVALVPAGRLWYVIRAVGGVLVAIDGPGFLTPGAAVQAARRRYRALLMAEIERTTAAAGEDGDDGDEEEAGRKAGAGTPTAGEPPDQGDLKHAGT